MKIKNAVWFVINALTIAAFLPFMFSGPAFIIACGISGLVCGFIWGYLDIIDSKPSASK